MHNFFQQATQLLTGLLPKDQNAEMIETSSDRVKDWFISFFGVYGSIGCCAIIAFGDGFFFSDMRMPSWDMWVIVCYLTGILIAGIGMTLLFRASKHYYEQQYRSMLLPLSIAGAFAIVSAMAQYLLLLHQLDATGMNYATAAVEQIPAFSLFLGVAALKGMPGFLFLRVLLYHVAEFSCVFLVRERKLDIEATLKKKREAQLQFALLEQQEQALAMIQQMQQLTMRATQTAMLHMQEEAERYSGASLANRQRMAGIEPATSKDIESYAPTQPPVLRTIPRQKSS